MTKPEVLIVGGSRTPMTDYVGALKDVPALELGAIAARGAFEKYGIKPEWIDHAVFGNVLQTSADAIYGARHVALKAGVPIEVPALTVNRLCGSGIQAAVSGAQMIQLGEAALVLTGGVESMSQAPHVIRGLRTGLKLGQGKLEDSLWEGLVDSYCGCPMAITAENCAAKYGIGREAQDAYALRSQQRTAGAQESGRLAVEIVAVEVPSRKGDPVVVDRDEHPRPTSLEALAKLKPIVRKDGTVTAGSSSGINDGAAAIIIASEEAARRNGLTPRARILGAAVAGVPPRIMGIGPAPATGKLLKRLGIAIGDLDVIELNEAFAAQALAVLRKLGLPDDTEHVNPNGGAIALGHPLGMSGARLALTATEELHRRGGRYALATMCIGVGQGIALALERV